MAKINNTPGCIVQVEVSYSFNYLLPFLPKHAMQLNRTSAVTILQ